jgi:hypothetical protein
MILYLYINPYSILHPLREFLNPYSVLTPPGGVLGFLKITHLQIFLLYVYLSLVK